MIFVIEIVPVILIMYLPFTLSEWISIIEGSDNDYDGRVCVSDIITICGSFLTLREETIIFVHQSVKEFLLREALNDIFPEGIGAKTHKIAERSLGSMFKILRPDSNHLESVVYNESRGLIQRYLHWLKALSILESVSHKGSKLVLGSNDKIIRICYSTTGQTLSTLRGHDGQVTLISWSPDRSRLTSPSDDKTIRIWDIAPVRAYRLSRDIEIRLSLDFCKTQYNPDQTRDGLGSFL
ncbi:uncharacterized protein N7496_005193 [Penicillium cataractarum]|uniref:Uncharacterized protein n=1 Tax=Penicillium cataractarum TaxID=2100454 RepID=A0A9W9VEF5_9EURO|nr:uncharacterized protein N7496_005193 [Penicillium cataractarum]KAJ5377784.1 hypothetical protein N7496_005193 [Penicillium cataractarum]